ncbi:MAG: DUF3883 domain-containing protein [Terriglobales bacterium]
MSTPAPGIYGTNWQDSELDAIVADYFEMLTAQLDWRPYSKSEHNAALATRIRRTHGSIEYKHQNISAVLASLGLPWIIGYKPMPNYQGAILDAIDRYLSGHQSALEHVPTVPAVIAASVFVPAPLLQPSGPPSPLLQSLVRKFDPVGRDFRNRLLGKRGEEFAIHVEHERLAAAGRPDLARRIRWVAEEDGDGAGYDVLSFDVAGRERLLEVKTTNGPAHTPFFLSRNECGIALERPREWCIYRVHEFASRPHIFTLTPPLDASVSLSPETWRASFVREGC